VAEKPGVDQQRIDAEAFGVDGGSQAHDAATDDQKGG